MGFPIRKSTDQSLLAAPRGLSQRTTSFIACVRQGIHRMPLRHLITPIADARPCERPATMSKKPAIISEMSDMPPPSHAGTATDRTTLPLHDVKQPARHTGVPGKTVPRAAPMQPAGRSGGARRDRTDDLLLAKQALSQLSYGPGIRVPRAGRLRTGTGVRPGPDRMLLRRRDESTGRWWAWVDLNYRPHAYQACALTN